MKSSVDPDHIDSEASWSGSTTLFSKEGKAKEKYTKVSRAPPHLVEMPRIYTFFSLKKTK